MRKAENFLKKRNNRKTDKKIFQLAKIHLKPGLYCFTDSKIKKISIHNINLHNMFNCFVKLSSGKNGSSVNRFQKYTEAEYAFGYGKDIFIFSDIAVGFYKTHELFEKSKNNYQNYKQAFVYPVVKVLSFIDEDESVIMEKACGVQYCDKKHDDYLIDKLFSYALASPVIIKDNGECAYLQHGDIKRENTVWTDENKFIFIDLDGMSYLPLFFDILHYCSMIGMNLDEIIIVIESHGSIVGQVLSKFNISEENNYLDFIFYYYAVFFMRLGDCFEDISFLLDADLSCFPMTYELLRRMSKTQIPESFN